MDYLDEVSHFVADTLPAAVPNAVLRRAALIVADCIGAISGGMAEPEMRALVARPGLAEGGPAAVIGTTKYAQPAQAAFLNGTAGTVLEMDEGNQFSRGHPGIHTVPAALAFASGREISGRDLLIAIIMGYEVGARIGIATNLRPSLHPHGTWGAVCAAVAVAKLAGRDAKSIRHAINMSASFALSTSRRTMLEGGTVRNAFAGISGKMGLIVHDLLEAGFEGDRDGLGEVFGRTLSESFERAQITEALGCRWEVNRNYFKMHACCRFNHAALDALALIAGKVDAIDPASIAEIEVTTYNLAVELNDPTPRNTLAARFSIPFAVATALVTGRTDVDSFTVDRLADPDITRVAALVRLVEDKDMTAALPNRRPARITLSMKNGTQLTAETATNRGDWAEPYPEAELRSKFLSLTTRFWRPESAASLWDEILDMPNHASAGYLLNRLTIDD